jgi:LSD1 subclass zinc finger protein
MRLLVAENDPALATFPHNSFDAEHYAVDLTRNSEEAKQMLQERSRDVAILTDEPAHAGNQAPKFHFKRRSIKLLMTRYVVVPNRLAASGYGEYYPAASNQTEEGCAMNGRVDLVTEFACGSCRRAAPLALVPGATQSNVAPQ